MERDKLAERYQATEAEIKKIENSGEVYLYATKDKYLPKIGYIHEINSIDGLLKAHHIVTKSNEEKYDKSAQALGITTKEMPKAQEDLLLGIRTSLWETDIKTRLSELRMEIRLTKLKKDADILRRNLNDEDNFKLDMLQLSEETV